MTGETTVLRVAYRQCDVEPGALADFASHVELPAMVLHDPHGQRQPQSCSFALSCVERAEDIGQVLGGDARAIVSYGNIRAAIRVSDLYAHLSRSIDGLDGILQQV